MACLMCYYDSMCVIIVVSYDFLNFTSELSENPMRQHHAYVYRAKYPKTFPSIHTINMWICVSLSSPSPYCWSEWPQERRSACSRLYFSLIPISFQSHSNKAFCLGNTEVHQWDCTSRLNNQGRQNGNFMMKFTPKNTYRAKTRREVDIWMQNPVWITTRCRLSVSRQTGWTRNLSDVFSTNPLIPN